MNDPPHYSLRDDLLHEIEGEESSLGQVSRPTVTMDSEPAPAVGTEPSAGQPGATVVPSRAGSEITHSIRTGLSRDGSGSSAAGPTCRDLFDSFPKDPPLQPANFLATRAFLRQL